jgi:hypothetical protein
LVLVTFAVASPITLAIRVAFDRREKALERIANIRAYFQHIYLIHAVWDWDGDDDEHCYHDKIKSSGRARCTIDFVKHTDMVLEELIAMGDELARFLSLPNTSRGWNRTTTAGRAEAARTVQAAYGLLESITIQRMARLTVYSERLKRYGLSGSEMSRVRSFERHLSAQLEELRLLKMYRTPQALWSFARIFTLILPPFYGPTFAQVAHQTDCIYIGVMFGIVTSLILTALLEAVQVLEDPFTAFVTLDGIDVREECKCHGLVRRSASVCHSVRRSVGRSVMISSLHYLLTIFVRCNDMQNSHIRTVEVLNWNQLVKNRKLFFPSAPDYPLGARAALTGMRYDPICHIHSTRQERMELLEADLELGEPTTELGHYPNTTNAVPQTRKKRNPSPNKDHHSIKKNKHNNNKKGVVDPRKSAWSRSSANAVHSSSHWYYWFQPTPLTESTSISSTESSNKST